MGRPKRLKAQSGTDAKKRVPDSASKKDDFNRSYLRWSVYRMDHRYQGSWEWANCTGEDMRELLSFLFEYSNKTWGEILREETGGRRRHRKHHDMDVSVLSKEAQQRLTKIFTGEELPDTLFRFRVTSSPPLRAGLPA